MGRPKGAKNKLYDLGNGMLGTKCMLTRQPVIPPPAGQVKSDDEILTEIKDRFGVMSILVDGAIEGNIRALLISGASGVGKSYMILKKLQSARTFDETRFEIISGGISAINLYKLGYKMRHPGSVIVLDDSDKIIKDIEGLAILKALCDSGQFRTVHWLKESAALIDDDGNPIETSYEFEGTMVFVTNYNIQKLAEEDKNAFASQLKALSDRALYLDLLIHDRSQLAVWVNHVASSSNLFEEQEVSPAQGAQILQYINDHRDTLRDLSLRTVTKSCDLMKTVARVGTVTFEQLANTTLIRRTP